MANSDNSLTVSKRKAFWLRRPPVTQSGRHGKPIDFFDDVFENTGQTSYRRFYTTPTF
jgi:hypothetical protein